MTTAQIIIITGLCLMALVGAVGGFISNRRKDGFIFILLLAFTVMTFIACVATNGMMHFKKIRDGKCPEYEKVENVYRLKK
jgi:ABC-type branched-subunit amino acid transport system permease subunit